MNDIHELAAQYFDDAVKNLASWIQIDSVYDKSTITKETPFGNGVNKALRFIGELAAKDGFKVDYCDGYCTEISFGSGPLIAIYAHADVVPVSGNWKFPPFSAHIEDGIMYGRGTSDDKGPAMASYYALKLLKEAKLLHGYKVTLVIGGNEETHSDCLKHYFEVMKKPYPVYGFTPDGDFPLIYGEKAIATYKVELKENFDNLVSLNGGVVINSVIDKASATLKVMPGNAVIAKYCDAHGLTFEIDENTLIFFGKASHGSLPQLGVNAGLHLIKFIGETFGYASLVKTADSYLDGLGIGLNLHFESELLHSTTYNVGLISYKKGTLEYSVNFRYPETVDCGMVINKLSSMGMGKVTFLGTSDYLLMNPKSDMVKILMKCYQEETGDYESKPMAIGGGTYAKESKNTLAFGSHFPGREDNIHDANEKIHLEDLTSSISIYAKAIHELGKKAGSN